MTVLVAYATHSGATRTLADTLVAALTDEGLEALAVDVEDVPDPAVHDAVVLGSGVRVESIEKAAAAWAKAHVEALGARPFAFFTCSGSAADRARAGKQKAADAFLASFPVTPVARRNFPGWVLLDRIPVSERILLRSLRTPTGDFRDLPAVAAWGREITPLLRG